MSNKSKSDALQIFQAAVASVKPMHLMHQHLHVDENSVRIGNYQHELNTINQIIVIAAGKAAGEMAQQAEEQLGALITSGICITKYHHRLPLKIIQSIESGHPLPDENSLRAGATIKQLLKNVSGTDVVLVLLSGGASALMEDLQEGMTLKEVQQTVSALIRAGASIKEINTVRKHLSRLKGGGLARIAYPAYIHTLVLSDVVGDPLDVIASGPTVPDTTTFSEASSVLRKYQLWESIPESITSHISKGLKNEVAETAKPGDMWFVNSFITIIGSNRIALLSAKKEAETLGYLTRIWKENAEDDTVQLARSFVHQLLLVEDSRPVCLLIGGEPTLKVDGNGLGGRNQHFVLCGLDAMIKNPVMMHRSITLLSAGTDGTDGPTDAAGAIVDLDINHALPDRNGLQQYLKNFDAYHYFEKSGALIKTGPTQTNVMDIIVALLYE